MSVDSQDGRTIQEYELEEEKPYNCRKCGKGFKKESQRDQHEQKPGNHINLLAQWEFRKEVEDQKLSKESLLERLESSEYKSHQGKRLMNFKIRRVFDWLIQKSGGGNSTLISYSWIENKTNTSAQIVGPFLELLCDLDMASCVSNSGRTYSIQADTDDLENLRDTLYELAVEEGYKNEWKAQLLGWL